MAEDPIKAMCHYAQAREAPRIRESAARLAQQPRDGGWSHEEYLAAVLSRKVASREACGTGGFHSVEDLVSLADELDSATVGDAAGARVDVANGLAILDFSWAKVGSICSLKQQTE